MKRILAVMAVLCAFFAATAPSVFAADFTVITDSEEFLQVVGDNPVVDLYTSPPYPESSSEISNELMNAVVGETTYLPTAILDLNWVGDNNYSASCRSYWMSFYSTSVSEMTPAGVGGVYAAGIVVVENVYDTVPYTALVYFGDNSYTYAEMPSAGFWGIVSREKITNFHFGNPGGDIKQDGCFIITTLVIGDGKVKLFADGFENGSTINWSATVPPMPT